MEKESIERSFKAAFARIHSLEVELERKRHEAEIAELRAMYEEREREASLTGHLRIPLWIAAGLIVGYFLFEASF